MRKGHVFTHKNITFPGEKSQDNNAKEKSQKNGVTAKRLHRVYNVDEVLR